MLQNHFRPAVPEQLIDGPRRGPGSTEQPPDIERLEAITEQDERSGGHQQSGECGEHDGGHPGIGE